MKNWTKVKTATVVNSFASGLKNTSREKKLIFLHKQDYSTRDNLLKWLEDAETIITENQTTITDLLGKKASYLNLIKQLHTDLVDKSEDQQKLAQSQILHYSQAAEQNTHEIEQYLAESSFIQEELEKIQDPTFLQEAELITVLTEKQELIANLRGQIKTITRSDSAIKDESTKLQRRSSQLTIASDNASEKAQTFSTIAEENPATPSSREQELHKLLAHIKKRWNNHLTGVNKSEFYEGQEETMQTLTADLATTLENRTNIYQGTKALVKKWTTDYPHWVDAKSDLFWLKHYLTNWNNTQADSETSDQLGEANLEIENLKRKLTEAQTVATKKAQEWKEANDNAEKEVKKVISSSKAKYAKFINPVNLEKEAKAKLNMKTPHEVEEEVNKALIPLQEWENTFENKTPVEVKEAQEQLVQEKEQLENDKIELNKDKQELTANLDEWKDSFPGKDANEAKEELATAISEKSKYRLERKAMEIDRDNYKEDSERMNKEVTNYYEEYKRFLDLLSKERDRTSALEEQIYSLGVEPIPEEDEEENNSNQADNISENNDNDNNSLSGEQEPSENNSVTESAEEPVSDTQSLPERDNQNDNDNNSLTEENEEEEFKEDELSEESKELLKQIKEHKANLAKYIVKEKTITDTQYLQQIAEIKADLTKWISEKKQKLRVLIEKEQSQTAHMEVVSD